MYNTQSYTADTHTYSESVKHLPLPSVTMPRKIQRKMMTCQEGHRRSPRLSNQDAWKAAARKSTDQKLVGKMGPPPPRTNRGRKSTNLASVHQDIESPDREDYPSDSGQPMVVQVSQKNEDGAIRSCQQSVMSFTSVPDKCTLELVIDILQRRDTNEIFSEPVDPSEVEDYYEIIEEPMDFGTMRAKLHEGLYKSLEQFEHDVFLISGNAMHFNPSATMYFRQARAIHELSKKVFHVLKNEPEKLESKFSVSRRRHIESPFSLSPKRGINMRSSNWRTDQSLSRPSKSRKTIQEDPESSVRVNPTKTSGLDFFSGTKDNEWASSVQQDRRCTYKPWTDFNNSNTLVHVNQQGLSYTESLMLFCKDLGPIAQKIANRKLQAVVCNNPDFRTSFSNGITQMPAIHNPSGSASTQWRFLTPNIGTTSTASQNLHDPNYGKSTVFKDSTGLGGRIHTYNDAPVSTMANNNNEKCTLRNGINGGLFRGPNMVNQKDNARNSMDSDYSLVGFGNSKLSNVCNNINDQSKATAMNMGKMDTSMQPLEPGNHSWPLKNLQSQAPPCSNNGFGHSNFSNVWNSTKMQSSETGNPSWPMKTTGTPNLSDTKAAMHDLESLPTPNPSNAFGKSYQTGGDLELNQPMCLAYLKSRLNQMNSLGQQGYLQQCSSLDQTRHTNLALQLETID